VRWCEEKGSGEALFIDARGCCGARLGSIMAATFGAAKGQGEVRVKVEKSWRSRGASLCSRRGTGACGRRRRSRSTGTTDVDDDGFYRARASQWGCLGGSWWRGEAAGERRGRGEDGCDGGSAVYWRIQGLVVHALASLGAVTTSRSRACHVPLGLGSCLACSAEKGELAWQGERERRGPV
jgi:hypothetical protein